MKIKHSISITAMVFLALMTAFPNLTCNATGPINPAGVGTGILGFGFGPGIPFYGGHGFGPAILVHYDHGLWKAGPGTISLGGQIGISFFSDNILHEEDYYKHHRTNLGIVFRGAYHYGWKVPGLDTYAGFGAGTLFSMSNENGPDPDKKESRIGFLPTAFAGGSYFFNDVVGINTEFGFDFAYMSIGLNFRLFK